MRSWTRCCVPWSTSPALGSVPSWPSKARSRWMSSRPPETKGEISTRIPSDRSYQPGQPVQLLPRTSEIYFFDSVTEKRIKMK